MKIIHSTEDTHDHETTENLVNPYGEILHVLNISTSEFTADRLDEVVEHFSERLTCPSTNQSLVSVLIPGILNSVTIIAICCYE